eukprot:8677472-Heterocapsa_arctica.AAC.1
MMRGNMLAELMPTAGVGVHRRSGISCESSRQRVGYTALLLTRLSSVRGWLHPMWSYDDVAITIS